MQGAEAGAVLARAAVARIFVDAVPVEGPAFPLRVPLKPCDLLIDFQVPRLARGGHPGVDRRAHQSPPPSGFPSRPPIGGGAGKPDPSDGWRRRGQPSCVERSSSVSSIPPLRTTSLGGGYPRRLGLSFSRLRRVKQNLSFVISPSITTSGFGGSMVCGRSCIPLSESICASA